MNRREIVQGGAAFVAFVGAIGSADPAAAQTDAADASTPFDAEWLISEAERLAGAAYEPPSTELPDGYADLTYDQYRDIWFRPEASIWAGEPVQFNLDLFHRGFIFKDPVKIALVQEGQAWPIPFSTSLFGYKPLVQPPSDAEGMDFSGFRARTQINTPGAWQEFLVFQGASYFRAVARDQVYGISARGLAVNTAEPEGEEFPGFRQFWIERPAANSTVLTVHALLDSPSVAGAYRFDVSAGMETVITVSATIFPRREIKKLGIAPLTSMFMFNAVNRGGFDDFRRAVHDSDGLQILTGTGEWIWRALANPRELQMSNFRDKRPRGFGLMQRARDYDDFEDAEARYQDRPSLWIEPLGDWGEGFVELVEIPTDKETNDNIVAYWRPNGTVQPGEPWRISYRMRWTNLVRPQSELLTVVKSRAGLSFDQKRRLFVVDFRYAPDAPTVLLDRPLAMQASASRGAVVNALVHENRPHGDTRVSFELDAGSEELIELRMLLTADGQPASETWLYRWTAS